jgi:hypothetical protein
MANKYHRKGFKIGSGKKILKAIFPDKTVKSKLPDDNVVEEIENIYKLDKTGKKDNIIGQLNKALKKNPKRFPRLLDIYTDTMTSDFSKKTGPYFDRLRRENEERRLKNIAKKKNKDK